MNIKNNISTLSQDLFKSHISKEITAISKIENHNTSAYKLDISTYGMRVMESLKSQDIVIFNSDALEYKKDLQIINKQY